MGLDNIPLRLSGTKILAEWANVFRRVLAGDVVPRNTSGIPTDVGGSLGSATYRWNELFSRYVRIRDAGGYQASLKAATSGTQWEATMPPNLPASEEGAWFVNAAGVMAFRIPNRSISSNISYSNSTTTETDVASVSLTTNGRPVWVGLVSDSAGANSVVAALGTTNTIRIYRGATKIAEFTPVLGSVWSLPSSAFCTFDAPVAGTYTYKITSQGSVTGQSVSGRLLARELA